MTLDDLCELILAAPTPGAAQSASTTLNGLASDGDDSAAAARVDVLARALGGGEDRSHWPLALQAYALAMRPMDFLGTGAEPSPAAELAPAWQAADEAAFAALQGLVRTRHLLQHEALKAHVLAALRLQLRMHAALGTVAPGRLLPVLDRALADTRVVEGADADAGLRFGRDWLLGLHSLHGLQWAIQHELGHNLLDLLWGAGAAPQGSAGATDDGRLGAAAAALAEALPAVLRAARAQHGQAIVPGDPRSVRTDGGVRLLCTFEQRPGGAYFHASLTQDGGPIDLGFGAALAHALLRSAGTDPERAAVAHSPRGLLHFGFRAEDLSTADRPATPDPAGAAGSAAWLDDLQRSHRLGHHERDIAVALGVEAPRPRLHGRDPERTAEDLNLLAQARAAGWLAPGGADLLRPGSDAQIGRLLAAAWRGADPGLLTRVLEARPDAAAMLREAAWPLGEIGCSLCAQRTGEATTLHGPTAGDIGDVLQALHAHGVPLDGPADESGDTLLTRAAALGAGRGAGVVRLLLGCGADPSRPGRDGDTPLHASVAAADPDAAEALLAAGAAVDAGNRDGASALHRAVALDRADLVSCLLRHGAAPDLADTLGAAPLAGARGAGIVETLLAAGATVDAAAADGSTALMTAARCGRGPVVAALLAQGADPDRADALGATALHHAARAGCAACADRLLAAGADVDEETADGTTPLMEAARFGHEATVQRLLAGGARVDARDAAGATALRRAACGGSEPVLRALVAAGADLEAADEDGITAAQAAARRGDTARVQLLVSLGAEAPGAADAPPTAPTESA